MNNAVTAADNHYMTETSRSRTFKAARGAVTILFLQVRTLKEVKKLTQNIMLSEKSQTERQIVQSITSKWNLAGGRGVGGRRLDSPDKQSHRG